MSCILTLVIFIYEVSTLDLLQNYLSSNRHLNRTFFLFSSIIIFPKFILGLTKTILIGYCFKKVALKMFAKNVNRLMNAKVDFLEKVSQGELVSVFGYSSQAFEKQLFEKYNNFTTVFIICFISIVATFFKTNNVFVSLPILLFCVGFLTILQNFIFISKKCISI